MSWSAIRPAGNPGTIWSNYCRPMFFFALVGLLGVVFLYAARRTRHHAQVLADVPAYHLADAAPVTSEAPVAVRGRATRPEGSRLEAPASARPCVWWALRVRPKVGFARRFSVMREATSEQPFLLTGGGRTVRVDPRHLMSYGHPHSLAVSERQPGRFSTTPPPPVTRRIRTLVPSVARAADRGAGRVDITEWIIEDGEEVTVTGALETDVATGETVLRAYRPDGSRGTIFSVTPQADHRQVEDLRRSYRRSMIVGFAFLAGGVMCLAGGLLAQVR